MPAVSKKLRRASAIAEHHPEILYARNRGLASMTKAQLHDFATTPERGLPMKAPKASRTGHTSATTAHGEAHTYDHRKDRRSPRARRS